MSIEKPGHTLTQYFSYSLNSFKYCINKIQIALLIGRLLIYTFYFLMQTLKSSTTKYFIQLIKSKIIYLFFIYLKTGLQFDNFKKVALNVAFNVALNVTMEITIDTVFGILWGLLIVFVTSPNWSKQYNLQTCEDNNNLEFNRQVNQ